MFSLWLFMLALDLWLISKVEDFFRGDESNWKTCSLRFVFLFQFISFIFIFQAGCRYHGYDSIVIAKKRNTPSKSHYSVVSPKQGNLNTKTLLTKLLPFLSKIQLTKNPKSHSFYLVCLQSRDIYQTTGVHLSAKTLSHSGLILKIDLWPLVCQSQFPLCFFASAKRRTWSKQWPVHCIE